MNTRWYIVDLDDGAVKGTDDEDKARDFAKSEAYVVIDSNKGTVIDYNQESRHYDIPAA